MQIAACLAFAKRNGYDYFIPTYTTSKHPTYQYKNVKYGNIELPIFSEDEKKFNIIPKQDNICLRGYFQDYNYFIDYFEDIREALGLDWKMNNGVVAIHQRRTDYLKRPDAFPPTSLEYVGKAIEYFKWFGYENFKCFSDDIQFCKENITSEKYGVNVTYSEGKHPIEDLVEQSCAEHQVIANSTFSVWAAYLNQNPNKIIIRPSFFLGKKYSHLHKNIYLPDWKIIEN